MCVKVLKQTARHKGGDLAVWLYRRSLATLEERSSIIGGNNNVIVTKSNWPTVHGELSVLR